MRMKLAESIAQNIHLQLYRTTTINKHAQTSVQNVTVTNKLTKHEVSIYFAYTVSKNR